MKTFEFTAECTTDSFIKVIDAFIEAGETSFEIIDHVGMADIRYYVFKEYYGLGILKSATLLPQQSKSGSELEINEIWSIN